MLEVDELLGKGDRGWDEGDGWGGLLAEEGAADHGFYLGAEVGQGEVL